MLGWIKVVVLNKNRQIVVSQFDEFKKPQERQGSSVSVHKGKHKQLLRGKLGGYR